MLDLPEFPAIKDATTSTLRLENAVASRLPSMPGGATNDLGFTNYRQLEAEQLANEMRSAYAISRQYDRRSRAIARAKNRRAQRAAERR